MGKLKFFALLLAILLLAGCGSTGETPEKGGTAPPTEVSSQSSMTAARTENSDRPLTDEEILSAYGRAVSAYKWFDLSTMPCGAGTRTVDGYAYQRVTYDGISSMEELRTYLLGLFSEEIVEKLLPEDQQPAHYRDIDGVLYALPADRGTDIHKGAATASVVQNGDDAYSVNVTVETLGDDLTTVTGIELCSFPYEKVDGRWVFTDFQLVN